MTPAAEYAFIASEAARGRARAAVRALNALGYDARHYGPESAEARRARAVVFCDLAPDTARFVYDVLDLGGVEHGRAAYAITAPSVELAQAAASRLGRPVEVVPEPLEGPRRAPRAARIRPRSRPLEWLARRAGLATDAWRTALLWTGEEPEVEAIVGAYPALKALGRELPLSLHCIADPEVLAALRAALPGYAAFFGGALDLPGKGSARKRFGNAIFSRLPAVPMTVAPSAFAHWQAMTPMPPEPP